ncbi:MAG: response regulator [candidate division Zixibacteria bacterium]|nr:response regulator [candidate division Zixibacteria bacterium]
MAENLTLLLVDDEPNVLKSLKRLFIDTDYRVIIANSGGEGLEKLKENAIQLVISDYRMPEMNGVEFLRLVKEQYPETIRIILSGYADVSAVVEAINDGEIYKFLAKPWNEQELLTAIMRSFEQYQLRIENKKLTYKLQRQNFELEKLAKSLEDKVVERTRALELKNRALSIAQNILNLLPVGVIGIDSEMTVVYFNMSLGNFIDTKAISLGTMLNQSKYPEVTRIMKAAIEGREPISILIDSDKTLGLTCTPLPNGCGVVGTFYYASCQKPFHRL